MRSSILSILGILLTTTMTDAQQIVNKGSDLTGFSTDFYSLPYIDLNGDIGRQVIVDKEKGVYLGHPTTHLLDDGKTILAVYPKGHGRGEVILKKSMDGGLTWSDRLPTPGSWKSSLEVPTLFPVEDAAGNKRLIMFSGLYPARMATADQYGSRWSELENIGDWGGIVVMGDLIPLTSGKGHYMAMFHDDGRFITKNGRSIEEKSRTGNNQALFSLYKTFSYDGGMNWSHPEEIFSSRILHLCEPGIIRSPDGRQIAVLLRENARRMNAHIIFSNDEGKSWTTPRQLPNALTGDRHQAIYSPDGRLIISFRDLSPGLSRYNTLKRECSNCEDSILKKQAGPVSPTAGDWVAWVGTYADLAEGKEGQYRIRLKDNTNGSDCAYPAMELLPDGTIVAITYGHWEEGENPYILSVRFTMAEIDAMAE